MENKSTVLCAAFCGTGKSYLCDEKNIIEFECWKYRGENFPDNYITDITNSIGKYEYIFISTNPIVLRKLNKKSLKINLIYPENNLKQEYFLRFKKRKSHSDFMDVLEKYWDMWLDEMKEEKYCHHIILNSGQYLQNVLQCCIS